MTLAGLAACQVDEGRADDGLGDPACVGSKCDDPSKDEGDGGDEDPTCWNDPEMLPTTELDTNVCDAFRSPLAGGGGMLTATNGEAKLRWSDGACQAILLDADACSPQDDVRCVCRDGLNCTIEAPVRAMLDGSDYSSQWEPVDPRAIAYARDLRPGTDTDASDLCFLLSLAQRRCGGSPLVESIAGEPSEWDARVQACGELTTSCIPGLENDCSRYDPPWLPADAPAAVGSRCAVQAYNGVGYPDATGWQQSIANWQTCLLQPAATTVRECKFLGNTVMVESEFCDVLEQCVHPALACFISADDPQRLELPSGDIELWTNGCQGGLNHSPSICRALDFNNQSNSGNIEVAGAADPEVNMPPEFVAVMEECGVTWGGRWSGLTVNECSGGRTDCCDPMHFDYAPGCVPEAQRATYVHRTRPPAGLCPSP